MVETEADRPEIGAGTWRKKVTLARNTGNEDFKRKKDERGDDCCRMIGRDVER